ncbi:MAG: hypothetical protein KDC98_16700 [Planctomycetes bacterium]|nr:hypothetical protein [Planctomycetota bacterium]
MRVVIVMTCVAVLGGLAGCGVEARAPGVDGTLVLELGGTSASLRESLRAAGVILEQVREPHFRSPNARGGAPRSTDPPRAPVTETVTEPMPEPVPEPVAEPDPPRLPVPTFREVELLQNETIIQLARRHLGDGRRYRDILTLNGWSDAQSRRLATGTMVRIPLE